MQRTLRSELQWKLVTSDIRWFQIVSKDCRVKQIGSIILIYDINMKGLFN